MGPASMDVWISSPVRSRKPVLMNMTRDLAARMHSLRFSVVRRSSSMMPILTVFLGSPSTRSTCVKMSSVNATSAGPCIFGLTTYTDPARELRGPSALARSCLAASTVTIASSKPSKASRPSRSRRAVVVSRWPTWRTSISARPGSVNDDPSGPVNVLSPLRAAREAATVLADLLGQIPPHQAQPVVIGEHLVLGVHRGDGILAVHDRRDGGLEQHVRDARPIDGAHGMPAVDQDLKGAGRDGAATPMTGPRAPP